MKMIDPLIGTWRLVEFADLDKDGKWQHRFGETPRGYFVYDATGHVHIQIMKVPPLLPFPEANVAEGKPPSAEQALAAYSAYVAYFGTYTVDPGKHVVTHHVEGSLAPEFTGTNQPRPFKLEGDHMEIGDGKTWRRVLERLSQSPPHQQSLSKAGTMQERKKAPEGSGATRNSRDAV